MKIRVIGSVFLVAVIMLFTFDMLWVAGAGVGSNGNLPLELASSSIQPDAVDVELDQRIELYFTNNVINTKVREGNLQCFELTDSKGKSIEIDILLANDLTEPDKKEVVVIRPTGKMDSGTTYTLTISKELMAKTGDQLSEDIRISFTTVKAKDLPYNYILIGAVFAAALYIFVIKKD